MSTLLLRLSAPLQSWGAESKFDIRDTAFEPTKSGVIGLLAAALGRKRDADISDLNTLRFGVRTDMPGSLIQDFHMVKKDEKTSYVTRRYYLSDAIFLVGLESSAKTFLNSLQEALEAPAFPLFLGRRSCPPTMPLCLGIRNKDLPAALRDEPWLVPDWRQIQWRRRNKNENPHLRITIDALSAEDRNAIQKDLPITFDPNHRQYGYRGYSVLKDAEIEIGTHDPMREL